MVYRISRGATINLGNYESARVDLEISGEGSNPAATDAMLKSWLEEQVRQIQEAAGLPPHPAERFTGGEE